MMENTTNYLTEEKLGDILKDIFPKAVINKQYKYGKHKYDYHISIKWEDNHPILDFIDEHYYEYDSSDLPENIEFLIEFDGLFHYTSNKQVVLDEEQGGQDSCSLVIVENNLFLIRIPYFIQLNATMTKKLFNIDKDYSNSFPQGFISKKCVLPECFSMLGVERFCTSLSALPSGVVEDIYKSLLIKSVDKKFEIIAPKEIWKCLYEAQPSSKEEIAKVTKVFPNGFDKFEKYTDEKTYLELKKEFPLYFFLYQQ